MSQCLFLLELLISRPPPPQQRKAIFCTASDGLIKTISEIAQDTLKGSIALTLQEIHMLKKGCRFSKSLSSKSVSREHSCSLQGYHRHVSIQVYTSQQCLLKRQHWIKHFHPDPHWSKTYSLSNLQLKSERKL